MPQDTGLGQDSPATTSAPSLPQRITRSIEQALGAKHQLLSLFLISIELGVISIIGRVCLSHGLLG